jgi:hypothetical protein
MGILRKLAELVVEFPEDKPPAGDSPQDVLASIEEVRGQIEAETAEHRAELEGTVTPAVEKMLADPEIAELPLETRARSVRMALRSMGRELPDIIADAAKRDRALEIYEQVVSEAIEDVGRQVVEANAKLQREIDEFVRSKTAMMEANEQALEQARQGLSEYRRTKAAEEERLFNTVAPFVAPGQNPVSLGDAANNTAKGKGS